MGRKEKQECGITGTPLTDPQNFKSQDWSTSIFSKQYQYIIQKQGYENQYDDHQGEILWFSFFTL